METQLLRDPAIVPSDEVLKDALGDNAFAAYESFACAIAGEQYGLISQWRYYNDGKSWLCRICDNAKTVLWLSVWEGFFKTSFFFTEKHLDRIAALDIAESIKEYFATAKPIGKLFPMLICIDAEDQLTDLLKVVAFKKSLK